MAEVLEQLAGFDVPAWAWENQIIARRVRDFRREWFDELTLSGEFVWGRFWGSAASPIRVTPIAFIPRERLDEWLALCDPACREGLSGPAADLLRVLSSRESRTLARSSRRFARPRGAMAVSTA